MDKQRTSSLSDELQRLCDIMAKLRGPDGCGWDKKQTLSSLKRYLIEETYETIDAIDTLENAPSEAANKEHLEELGDLLLQIVFQSQIQSESGAFNMNDVCRTISEKLIRRHPHIFADEEASLTHDENPHWERIKEQERAEKGLTRASVLDGIPRSMPALVRAQLLTAKASKVGFDWPSYDGVRAKLSEELNELDEAVESGQRDEIEHELGDIMLACIDAARHLKLDPKTTLKKANARFEMRFRHMEQATIADGKTIEALHANELDAYWERAKSHLGKSSHNSP